jgi:hypothetical protein
VQTSPAFAAHANKRGLATDEAPSLDWHRCSQYAQSFFLENLGEAHYGAHNDLRVQSQQLKYRKLITWPSMSSLQEFPFVVGRIEEVIGVKFIRHVNVGSNGLVDLDRFVAESGSRILQWLAPCADTIGTYLQSQ